MTLFSFSFLPLPSCLYLLQSSFFLQSLSFLLQPSLSFCATVFYPLQWPSPVLPRTSSWGKMVLTFLSIMASCTCSCQLHIGSLIAKKQVFYLLSSKWLYPTLWRKDAQLPAGYGEQGESLVAGRGFPLQGVVCLEKLFWEDPRDSVGLLASAQLLCKGSSCSCC